MLLFIITLIFTLTTLVHCASSSTLIKCHTMSTHQETQQIIFYNKNDFKQFHPSKSDENNIVFVLTDLNPATILSNFDLSFKMNPQTPNKPFKETSKHFSHHKLDLQLHIKIAKLYLVHLNYANIKELIQTKLKALFNAQNKNQNNTHNTNLEEPLPSYIFTDVLLELLNNEAIAFKTKVYPLEMSKSLQYTKSQHFPTESFPPIKHRISFFYGFGEFCPLLHILGNSVMVDVEYDISYTNGKCVVRNVKLIDLIPNGYYRNKLRKLKVGFNEVYEYKVVELLKKINSINEHPKFEEE
eukprot:GAHX01002460.1.p1 GENE.GAHX01002460.1~~GAHX01002460.1.p1  ORF type:complete len:298 (-),score=48.06 GAHX01002460.1:239-1132(-)